MSKNKNPHKGQTGEAAGTVIRTRLKPIDPRMNEQVAPVDLECRRCKSEIQKDEPIVIWEASSWIAPVHPDCAKSLLLLKIKARQRALESRSKKRKRRGRKNGKITRNVERTKDCLPRR